MSGASARRAAHHPSYYAAMVQLGKHESPFVHQIDLVSSWEAPGQTGGAGTPREAVCGDCPMCRQRAGGPRYETAAPIMQLPPAALCAAGAAVDSPQRTPCPFPRPVPLSQDVPRTFPNNAWVQSPAGQGALRHVLVAFAQHWPTVGCCQGMHGGGGAAEVLLYCCCCAAGVPPQGAMPGARLLCRWGTVRA